MLRYLKNTVHWLEAVLANWYYGFPSRNLQIIGVTGTDGKTTTSHLIGGILQKAGRRVEVVSTLNTSGLHTTTPSSWNLQRLLRQAHKRGVQDVVLESSSHGLDQNRLWGINFALGVVTNITHDHLDYHGSYEKYLEAKAKLLRMSKVVILNRDDKSYKKLKTLHSKTKTYGLSGLADFNPKNFSFKTKLPGSYNQYNCLAAVAVCLVLGVEPPKIREGIEEFEGVEGRMEEVQEGQNFQVFIDFASTPNSLKNVLEYLRSITKNNLWVVFGAAGERDRQKRPMMGKIASQLADEIILTAEDPRSEEVAQIIKEIEIGCLSHKKIYKIPDRRKALNFAINHAQKDDVVVVCGKGHEKSMCFGKIEYPWSDQEEARRALKDKFKGLKV